MSLPSPRAFFALLLFTERLFTTWSLEQATVLLFIVTIVLDEVRPKVMCVHAKLIIVCRRLREVKKRETARSVCLSCLLREQEQQKMFCFEFTRL